jgi:uncharacterized membrane-anchored protein
MKSLILLALLTVSSFYATADSSDIYSSSEAQVIDRMMELDECSSVENCMELIKSEALYIIDGVTITSDIDSEIEKLQEDGVCQLESDCLKVLGQ